MFRNREDAGFKLAAELIGRPFKDPLVLAIPRGGVVTGAVLAKQLNADLDVVLSQRLTVPGQADAVVGAVTDDGFMFLDPHSPHAHCEPEGYLADERRRQLRVLGRREQRIRQVCPRASIVGRSVIVNDDGIVTGSTMIAALQALRPLKPLELIVAIPVMPADRVGLLRTWCDDLIALLFPESMSMLNQYFEDFTDISDKQVLQMLRHHGNGGPSNGNGVRHPAPVLKGT